MADVAWLYSTKPGHSFTRTGKLGFIKTMSLIIAMEGGTIGEEMMEYFQTLVTGNMTIDIFSRMILQFLPTFILLFQFLSQFAVQLLFELEYKNPHFPQVLK